MSKVTWQADVEKYIGVKDVICFARGSGTESILCQYNTPDKSNNIDIEIARNVLRFSILTGSAIIYKEKTTKQCHLLGNGTIKITGRGSMGMEVLARCIPTSTNLSYQFFPSLVSSLSTTSYYCYAIQNCRYSSTNYATTAFTLSNWLAKTGSFWAPFSAGTDPISTDNSIAINKIYTLTKNIGEKELGHITAVNRSYANYLENGIFNIIKENVFKNNDCHDFLQKIYGSAKSKPFLTSPTSYSVVDDLDPYFYNIYTSSELDQCYKYLDDGTVPSDAECDTCDSDSGQVDSGQNTSSDEGDDNSGKDSAGDDGHVMDNSLPVAPSASALSMNNSNIYSISSAQLQTFQEWFSRVSFTEILTNYVTGKYNNLSSSILELYDMPVDDTYLGTKTTETIVVGGVDTTISADAFHGVAPLRTLGTYTITKKFDSYMNYAPYSSIELYLPYVGWSTLDTNLYSPSASEDSTTLTVQCMYDVLTGKITYFLLCNDTTMDIKEGIIMTKLEITLEDAVQYKSALANTLTQKSIGIITGAERGNIGAVASSIMGGVQPPPISVKGSASECAGLYSPQYCYILFKYPSYNRPSNYGKMLGFPCFKNRKLSTLSGFTKCINPKIAFMNTVPTENEQTKIYELLESGVYL